MAPFGPLARSEVALIREAGRAVALEAENWRHHLRLAYVAWGEERLRAAKEGPGRAREEEEAERLYEEAVGEVRSEQRAVQELGADGTNSPPVGPASAEEGTAPNDEQLPDEEQTRHGFS